MIRLLRLIALIGLIGAAYCGFYWLAAHTYLTAR